MSDSKRARVKAPAGVLIVAGAAFIIGALQVVSGVLLLFSGEDGSVWQAVLDFFVGALALVTALAMLQRSRLARLVVTVVLLLNIVLGVIALFVRPATDPVWAVGLVIGLLGIAGLVVLWTPAASRYFTE